MKEKLNKRKKQRKISFLIAAHNEEKIIAATLKNLSELPYENYEVIIGLDGCTDNTENIVKEFARKKPKVFKYYKLNLRQGKPAVIDEILKHTTGEVIIINDADWIFKVKNKDELEKFLSVFNNHKIGGIAESFPVEWDRKKIKKGNLGYKIVAYGSYLWLKFQKEKLVYKEDNLLYLKEPTMFLTNIFRKELYKKNFSLGDDFERTKNIMDRGYKMVIFDDIEKPRMIAVYDKIYIKDILKQKTRTSIAREQLIKKDKLKIGFINYYLPSMWYIFKNSWFYGLDIGFLISLWLIITISGTLISKFKRLNTKEGWRLRARS